jgi:hypothetical protein
LVMPMSAHLAWKGQTKDQKNDDFCLRVDQEVGHSRCE